MAEFLLGFSLGMIAGQLLLVAGIKVMTERR
jgi:hypothetical protein